MSQPKLRPNEPDSGAVLERDLNSAAGANAMLSVAFRAIQYAKRLEHELAELRKQVTK